MGAPFFHSLSIKIFSREPDPVIAKSIIVCHPDGYHINDGKMR